jgi:hypothetical protein
MLTVMPNNSETMYYIIAYKELAGNPVNKGPDFRLCVRVFLPASECACVCMCVCSCVCFPDARICTMSLQLGEFSNMLLL